MESLGLSKIFWSKCRWKILEKFFLEYESWNNKWFHMRALSRDLDEQINSIKRELDNLNEIWILKHKTVLKKKIFYVIDEKFLLENIKEFTDIFLLSYNPLNKIKEYFKNKNDLEHYNLDFLDSLLWERAGVMRARMPQSWGES